MISPGETNEKQKNQGKKRKHHLLKIIKETSDGNINAENERKTIYTSMVMIAGLLILSRCF